MTNTEIIEFFKNKENVIEINESTFYHVDKSVHGTYTIFDDIVRIARNGQYFFIPIHSIRIIDNKLWITTM